ncbi:acid protease [Trametes gibbosa]|nr:acid protease [Trametes gibbosa]
MRPAPLAFSLVLLCSSELAAAVRLSLHGEPRPPRRRGNLAARTTVAGNTSVANVGDVKYLTDITLGGQKFSIQIDTGSSDLWVAGAVPNAKDTGKSTKIQYVVGGVQGLVNTVALDFAGYSVPDQAFLSISASSSYPAGSGIIGLGPSSGSSVKDALGGSPGDPVLDRIFKQNTTTPNYITMLLGRIRDPTDPPTGDLTVGELLPGYESVTSQPKLPVSTLAKSNAVNQHWQILMDADGIIGPAGNDIIDEFDVKTGVRSTSNSKQLTVVIDSGYSLPQVPPLVAEAIYKQVPGAQLVNLPTIDGPIWQIPCNKEINVTLKFGGVQFPIHPLDTSLDLNMTDVRGRPFCLGAFQPMQGSSDAFDMIFGMAFLRNAYTYINFGDFVDGAPDGTADPYVQLLPTTNDTAEAHADFLRVRGNSPWAPSGRSLRARLRAHLPLVIGLAVTGGVLLLVGLGVCGYYAYRNRRRRTAFFRPGQMYQQLHDPAPPEAHDLHLVPGANPPPYSEQGSYAQQGYGRPEGYDHGPPVGDEQKLGFQEGYNPSYSSPWDARY